MVYLNVHVQHLFLVYLITLFSCLQCKSLATQQQRQPRRKLSWRNGCKTLVGSWESQNKNQRKVRAVVLSYHAPPFPPSLPLFFYENFIVLFFSSAAGGLPTSSLEPKSSRLSASSSSSSDESDDDDSSSSGSGSSPSSSSDSDQGGK